MITTSLLPFPFLRASSPVQLSRLLAQYAVGSTVHYIQFGFLSEAKPDHVRRVELWCRKHCLVTRWAHDRGQTDGHPSVMVIEFKAGLLDLWRQEVGGPESLRQSPRFFLRTAVVDQELLVRAVLLQGTDPFLRIAG